MKTFVMILILAQAQPPVPADDRFAGLLELPEIFSTEPREAFEARPVIVYSQPTETSLQLGAINVRNPWKAGDGCPELDVRFVRNNREEIFPAHEIDYEQPAAIVIERRENWFRIKIEYGSGWVHREHDDLFAAYPALLKDALTYIPQAWDGKLFEFADRLSSQVEIPPGWRPFASNVLPVVVLDDTTASGELWLYVRVDVDSSCGTLPAELQSFEGWLPAYRASGDPAVWFHSRGC